MVPVLDARSEYRINAVNAGRRTAMCSTRLQCSICHVMTATATVCATRTQDRHSHTARSATACAAMLILSSNGRIYYAMPVHCGCRKLLICQPTATSRVALAGGHVQNFFPHDLMPSHGLFAKSKIIESGDHMATSWISRIDFSSRIPADSSYGNQTDATKIGCHSKMSAHRPA